MVQPRLNRMIKDGHYAMYDCFNGKERISGRFEVRNGVVIFASEADKWNIDRFPPGPMTNYTKNLIETLITNKVIRLENEILLTS